MIISDTQARSILLSLYNIAEKDADDVIANAASELAVRLETNKRTHTISEIDARIIRYALSKGSVDQPMKARRKTYARRVSLA